MFRNLDSPVDPVGDPLLGRFLVHAPVIPRADQAELIQKSVRARAVEASGACGRKRRGGLAAACGRENKQREKALH
ncbi:MAG: hypothetical protein FD180_722 [Planctomycetota bacterium]|nr:MAG: hypothetical protein FD180_722 [Planctomycetota bacterium]